MENLKDEFFRNFLFLFFFREMESYRILGIQHALQATLRDGENANTILGPHIKRENPTFDFTFTPICK